MPTQSLEWHVWSSSSGNNCHAVQRSLSSSASVYECIMGFFPCPILLARSTYAIFPHNCHWNVSLPSSASLWNGKFGRVEGQNTTIVFVFKKRCVSHRFWLKLSYRSSPQRKKQQQQMNSRIYLFFLYSLFELILWWGEVIWHFPLLDSIDNHNMDSIDLVSFLFTLSLTINC